MSFADPQSVTIGASTISLPRVSTGNYSAEYSSDDGNAILKVSHQNGKRKRHVIRLDHAKVAADPFDTGANDRYSMSSYIVVDVPNVGYTNAEALDVVQGLLDQARASSDALLVKLIGGES